MLAFVDESGCTGLKIQSGSSRYFVVAVVIFEELDVAHALDKRIDELHQEMGHGPKGEFRFYNTNRERRKMFLKAVARYNFQYLAIVINKDPKKLYGEGFKYPSAFYKYASKLVFENAKPLLNNAKVVIDGSGSREFRNQLSKYLKTHINEEGNRCIRKVKLEDSTRNNLLQLADMVAGSINRSLTGKRDAKDYRKIIKRREKHVQLWPK